MSADGSAIYDLGYRHHQGRRQGPGYATRVLFVHSLLGAYGLRRSGRSKIVPMLLAVTQLVPAVVVAILVNVQPPPDGELPFPYTSYVPTTWLLVTIYVAGQAPQAVSRDLRFRSISLYLSRPLARWQYAVAKYAALAAAVFLFVGIPLTVMYAGALLARLPAWDQTRGWLAGLAGAALFSLVLAGVGLVIAAFTPRRGIGVAVIVAVVLLLTTVAGIVGEVATQQNLRALADYIGLMSPFTLVDGVQVTLLHAESSTGPHPTGVVGGTVYLLATLATIGGCAGILLLRYRKVIS